MGTGGLFPVAKARQGRDADHSPPSSAEVVNEELYLLSPQASPWRVKGLFYFLPIKEITNCTEVGDFKDTLEPKCKNFDVNGRVKSAISN
jgi:hypothetical protein